MVYPLRQVDGVHVFSAATLTEAYLPHPAEDGGGPFYTLLCLLGLPLVISLNPLPPLIVRLYELLGLLHGDAVLLVDALGSPEVQTAEVNRLYAAAIFTELLRHL